MTPRSVIAVTVAALAAAAALHASSASGAVLQGHPPAWALMTFAVAAFTGSGR